MVEIKITYETLFDLLRREKGRNELQELERSFYEDVATYLFEKNKALEVTSSRGESEKIKIQLKNIKKILKELYELREKKIISLASSKVRTSSNLIDTGKLLSKEKELFEDACTLFSKYKEEILEKIIQESKKDYDYAQSHQKAMDAKEINEQKQTRDAKQEVKQENTKQDRKDANNEESAKTDDENTIIKIKIIHTLPRFLGVDKKIYGPYNQGDETKMPMQTAKLLLDKKRAERI